MRAPSRPQRPASGSGALGAGARDAGPERPAAGHQQRRREQGQAEDHGQEHAGGGERAERLAAADPSEEEREQGEHHGHRAGHDRGCRAAEGGAHRLVRVLAAGELLAVARHEQQRVVGRGAEHEHGRRARGLARDREPGLAEQVLRAARGAFGQQHREEGDQPEDRRAVDEDEQDQHDRRGADEQDAVDAAEDVRHVGGEARPAGDVRLQPVAPPGPRALAQRLDRGDEPSSSTSVNGTTITAAAPSSDTCGGDGSPAPGRSVSSSRSRRGRPR